MSSHKSVKMKHKLQAKVSLAREPTPDARPQTTDSDLGDLESELHFTVDTQHMHEKLDSMLAAVHSESNSIGAMREKMREFDLQKQQLQGLAKKLLQTEDYNAQMKAMNIHLQDTLSETQKQRNEMEVSYNATKSELIRAKEAAHVEKMEKLATVEQIAMLEAQIRKLTERNEQLERECKTIVAIEESNAILKSDISEMRRRFKEEKHAMSSKIQSMDAQIRSQDSKQTEVRALAMRIAQLLTSSNDTDESKAVQRQSVYQPIDSVKSAVGGQPVFPGTEEGPDMLLAMAMGQSNAADDSFFSAELGDNSFCSDSFESSPCDVKSLSSFYPSAKTIRSHSSEEKRAAAMHSTAASLQKIASGQSNAHEVAAFRKSSGGNKQKKLASSSSKPRIYMDEVTSGGLFRK